MKEINSSGKNIAILAFGAISGMILYFRSSIAQKLSDRYSQMSYNVHEPKIDFQASSLIVSQIQNQQSEDQQDSKIELKLLRLTIKKNSGIFNKLMQTIFREKDAFKKYFLQHKDSLAALLTNADIITTHSETADEEQLDSLRELNLFLKDSSDLVCPTIGLKNPITNSLAKVISLLVNTTEHSKASIAQFLQKVFNTKTASQVSRLLNKAAELEIFSAFVKAFEKVEEKDFQKVVTTLMKEDDMKNKLKASKKLVYVPGDEINAAKLTLFTKFMHSVDKVNLDVIIWTILSYQQIIENLAHNASKKHLNDLHQGECDRIKEVEQNNKSLTLLINTIMEITLHSRDLSEFFTLTQDDPCYQVTTWSGRKSTGLSQTTGEKIVEVAASNYGNMSVFTQYPEYTKCCGASSDAF